MYKYPGKKSNKKFEEIGRRYFNTNQKPTKHEMVELEGEFEVQKND